MSIDTQPRTQRRKQHYVEEGAVAVLAVGAVCGLLTLLFEGLLIEGLTSLFHHTDIGLPTGVFYALIVDLGIGMLFGSFLMKELH